MAVSTQDHVSISAHLARYCHFIDEGRTADWIALWASDGTYTLAGTEPIVGPAALGSIVQRTQASGKGRIRHMIANLTCDRGDAPDTVIASFHNLVTRWSEGASIVTLVVCQAVLVRTQQSWLIRKMDLAPPCG